MEIKQVYEYIIKIQSIAKIGLKFSKDPYAISNYNEINDLSLKLYEKIAFSVAKSSAISYGRILSHEESERILEDLLALPEPNYTPDGKKVIAILNMDKIKKLF